MEYFKKLMFLIWLGLLFFPVYVVGTEIIPVNESKDNYVASRFHLPKKICCLAMSSLKRTQARENNTLTLKQKQFRTGLLISGFTLGTALYGYFSWWDKNSSEFRVRHEGWFEADTPNGGADKLGHAYSFYVSTRLMRNGFEWAGHNRKRAAQLAGLTSGAVSLGVEVMDGFTEEYGFSTEDVIMNLTGIGVGVLLETYPQWDELFDLRLQYWPSDDARRLNDYDPLADYSGQTYLLITKASGVASLRKLKWLRYLELALGYGTRGYQPTDGTSTQPTNRNLYYGLSLNLSQLLNDTLFKTSKPEKSRTQKVTENILEYLQMPGTALLFKHNL